MLANAAMASANVSPLLSVLSQACRIDDRWIEVSKMSKKALNKAPINLNSLQTTLVAARVLLKANYYSNFILGIMNKIPKACLPLQAL